MQYVQPYIDEIVQALVGLLVVLVMGVIAELRARLKRWIDARTTAAQRETLHKLAAEAAAFAESMYSTGGGREKLQQASQYVSERAAALGIPVKGETILAAIEAAVLEYNAKVKAGKTRDAT